MTWSSRNEVFLWRGWWESTRRASSSASSVMAFCRARRTPSGREQRDELGCGPRRRSGTWCPSSGADLAVVCFDSSALVKLVVDEAGTDTAARLWDEADAVMASRLAFPEVRAALAAARRAARLDVVSERRACRDWDDFWSATRVIELTSSVAATAAQLAGMLVLGGADAVHLASALAVIDAEPILVAFDARLRTAALATGLVVAPARV